MGWHPGPPGYPRRATLLLLLTAHLVAAVGAPALVSWLGRRAFLLLALVPGAAAAWALSQTVAVTAGEGPTSLVSWVPVLGLELSFRLDTLSWFMVLLVGGIGFLVLVYCSVYFSPTSTSLGRFAGVFTGFAGAMLGLVTSDNLLLLFVFWELTTVLSYLLIGHYTTRRTARRAATKAILVTTAGGLAMLLGIVLLGQLAGTYRITGLLASPPDGTMAATAVVLILVGVVSKSALLPLHFWLPAAMAAPTPVSAYLHAAAMVKAGVYLVARFAPTYSGLDAWQVMVIGLGSLTLVVGGYAALHQHDLKLLLAYGTVSQLGLLTILLGTGSRAVALAGLAMLGAHAMFKAALFLVVGVVDAATGTRDITQLNAVWRRLPLTTLAATLAIASMIGIPPFAGYVAKEAALDAILSGDIGGWVGTMVVVAFVVGSTMTVAYGLRFLWGGFATKAGSTDVEPVVVVRPPLLLVFPALILAVGGLAVALLPGLGEQLLSPYANSYPRGDPGHLTLWPGLTPGVALSAAMILAGAILFLFRDRVERLQDAWRGPLDADTAYRAALRFVDRLASEVTSLSSRGSLPFYVGVILIVTVAFPGGAMLLGASIPGGVRVTDAAPQVLVGALIVTATILAVRSRRRLKAVLLTGITGYGTALLFYLYGAPDLALDQVLVETITLLVFVLVLRRLPAYFSNRPQDARRWVRLALGVVVGLTVAGFALVVPQTRVHESVSVDFPDLALDVGGGKNVVNVTLVDIRAWDTMGEISVLLAAATGVASLVFIRRRTRDIRRTRDFRTGELPVLGSDDPDPMALLRRPGSASGSRSLEWLRAGRTLAPQRRSIVFEVATRLLYHTMLIFAVWLLFSGHNAPGGGFAAGLVTGLALAVRYLAGGRYELAEAAPLHPGLLLGSGMFLAAGTGIAPMLLGGDVLQSALIHFTIPLLGEVHLVTSLFFDIGVYLVVVGLMLDILRSLGAEIDRQGEATGHDSDLVGPALEPAPPVRPRL